MTKIHTMRFNAAVTNLKAEADEDSATVSQALFGEQAEVLEECEGWLLIRNSRDDYEGYVKADISLRGESAALGATSHTVFVRSTLLFHKPDIKSRVVLRLPFGAELLLTRDHDQNFAVTDTGGFVWKAHCIAQDGTESSRGTGQDFGQKPSQNHVQVSGLQSANLAEIAEEKFLGAPYLWGGRTPDGFDCSGLVQMAAFACGIKLPRDSAQQEAWIVDDIDMKDRQRSDLVYWPGHTGILTSACSLLHATAHSLQSLVEPLEQVIARAGQPSSIKRIF